MTCFVYTMRNSAKPGTECYSAYILLLLCYYDVVYNATVVAVSRLLYNTQYTVVYLIKFDDTFASSCIYNMNNISISVREKLAARCIHLAQWRSIDYHLVRHSGERFYDDDSPWTNIIIIIILCIKTTLYIIFGEAL